MRPADAIAIEIPGFGYADFTPADIDFAISFPPRGLPALAGRGIGCP